MNLWKDRFYAAATRKQTSLLRPKKTDSPVQSLTDGFVLWVRSKEYEAASCSDREHMRGYWMALMDVVAGR